MDVDPWFWVWVALAAILFVAEIFSSGFFMLPFALGAVAAAILDLLHVAIGWQWVVFLGISAIALVGFRRFAERVTHEPPVRVGVDRLIGKSGTVIEALVPHSSEGCVRIDREEWRADDIEDRALDVGTTVVVLRVEGTHLVVRPDHGALAAGGALPGASDS